MIEILEAPALLTVQDGGRSGFRAQGVPVSGAMDRRALAVANLLIGNPPYASAFEWAVSGGAVRFVHGAHFALGGADVEAALNERAVSGETACHAAPGEVLRVVRFLRGRFLYLAVRGGLDVPEVLGSRSTYLPAAFGGFHGRRLRSGDAIPIGESIGLPRPGFVPPPQFGLDYDTPIVRVLTGLRITCLSEESRARLFTGHFRVAAHSDRMGYRLEGPPLEAQAGASFLSEPTCTGAIQVTEGGQLIALLADGPTVGGYPIIATVIGADLPILAQKTTGSVVTFVEIELEEAITALRRQASSLQELERLSRSGPELLGQ